MIAPKQTLRGTQALRLRFVAFVLAFVLCLAAPAVTLEQLSVEEMVAYSTHIVQGVVIDQQGLARGPLVYTEYRLKVSEVLQGQQGQDELRFVVPGGQIEGREQHFAGVPELQQGKPYLLFLRQGKNGLLQLVGMSQGLFEVSVTAKDGAAKDGAARNASTGNALASRGPIDGIMLDRKSGFRVQDTGKTLRLHDLRQTIRSAASRSSEAAQ